MNAKQAEKIATSEYWVNVIRFSDPKEAAKFEKKFRISDRAESGKVHYSRI